MFSYQMKQILRRLLRAPLFTTVSLVTLAVAVSANTVIFTLVNRVILNPLPYPDSEELIAVDHTSRQTGFKEIGISPSIYFIYREQNTTLQDIGAYENDAADVTGVGEPEHVRVLVVTDGVLPILGVTPVLGRLFTQQDDSPGSPKTAVLFYGYWQQKFGGDRSVIGRSIIVGGVPREIIGVLSQNFHFLDQEDSALLLPFQWDRSTTTLGSFNQRAIARLKPGITLGQASSNMSHLLPIVSRSFPATNSLSIKFYEEAHYMPNLQPLIGKVIGDVGNVLWILMGATLLLLLAACANIANLLIVRIEARRHEFAIRYALGSTWRRISADIIYESSAIGIIGSLIGLILAFLALQLIKTIGPTDIPRINEVTMNLPALFFTILIAVFASLLIGFIPILNNTGGRLSGDLSEGGRGLSYSHERHRTRKVLVIVQVAFSMVLLISSGLMVRTFLVLMHVVPGFALPDQLQTFRYYIPETQIPSSQPERVVRMEEEILNKLAAIPGVSGVSLGRSVPMGGNSYNNPVFVQDRAYALGEVTPTRRFNFVAPGFFATLGTRLIAGRDFTWTDVYQKIPVAIVSDSFAREYWPNVQSALGKRIRVANTDYWREIIGVAENVHYDGVDRSAPPIVYWPLMMDFFGGQKQFMRRNITFIIRSSLAGSQAFLKDVQQQVWSVNPDVPLADLQTLGELYTKFMARTSFTLVILCISGAVTLLLGTVGIYGVISYSVSQRTREIGIQMALGAQRRTVIASFVSQGMWCTAIGVAAGLVVAFVTMRLMSSLLFGVSPADPITYIATSCAVTLAALIACYLPARRAASVDPVRALRAE